MRAPSLRIVALASLLLSATPSWSQARQYLNVGDPAPALKPAKWLKGAPISGFEKGHVYVVEFWATWCGPCKANIPHLTAMAKKFAGKVSIVGVNIWESPDPSIPTLSKVAQFVKAQGARMEYHVAADGNDRRVANAWMKSAGEEGLPQSFIVGKDGRIAWIGDPTQLETVLTQVTEDRFDVAAARANRALEVEVTRPIAEAKEKKDWKGLLRLTETQMAAHPEIATRYGYDHLLAQFHLDLSAGRAEAESILAETGNAIGIYQMIASIFATEKDLSKATYTYGRSLVDAALAKKEREYLFLSMGAEIDESLGDHEAALRSQTEAVRIGSQDPHCSPEFLAFLKKRLADLKRKSS